MSKLDEVLREQIREYAKEELQKELSEEEVEQAIRGVRHWYLETVNDSINTAIGEIM